MLAPIFKSITYSNRIILTQNVTWILVTTTAASLILAAYPM